MVWQVIVMIFWGNSLKRVAGSRHLWLKVELRSQTSRRGENPHVHIHQVANRMREEMEDFLGNLPGLPKVARRFCLEGLYGVVTRKSLRLSEIARALNEEIALSKTVNRLSRQAAREDLEWALTRYVARRGTEHVKRDTLLVIDPSDLTKKYGEKMEYLARVRDGSKGELSDGYWLCQVVAVECGGQEITPLVNHLWSAEAPDFVSENEEVLRCVAEVSRFTEERGIWVMDRGGDRIRLFDTLLAWDRRFLVRLVGNRDLLWRGRERLASEIAQHTPLPYIEHVTKQNADGSEKIVELSFGARPVRLPEWPDRPLWLLVVKGFGQDPLLILTTEELRDSRRSLWWALEAYLTRWRIEETLRFAKQAYALEDVRVLRYRRLKNLMAVALLAMYFTMSWLGMREKLAILCHHALVAGRRLFGIPDFRYYALADGLSEILSRRSKRAFPDDASSAVATLQLDLFTLV
jgi:hypothetical protein